MRLRLIADDDCKSGDCPKIYATDRGTVVVQGYKTADHGLTLLGLGEPAVRRDTPTWRLELQESDQLPTNVHAEVRSGTHVSQENLVNRHRSQAQMLGETLAGAHAGHSGGHSNISTA